ncbi:huntingtin-like isoform X1 [Lytechinus variegatus]|uniref:huntingtin-like isoform X1 n=1 Tax=Lytechinus variegatus TaxID=7654 RepID=UPI001BB180B4|nr:huntingtin-like isoform X1 [Lytechinus variegatus]
MNRAVSVSNMEKLARSFEALKNHQQSSTSVDDTTSTGKDAKKKDVTLTKKDYIANLTVIAEGISTANFRTLGEFPKFLGIAMEIFLTSCNDNESDIRLKADECLNKVIKACMESSLGRLQLELYKEIKKNGPSRSLRAALWRFAEMAHLIRPQKCRPYVINLLPSIARISRRPEDIVQEALMNFLIKTLPVLGSFLTDTEVKNLMKVLFPNLKHTSATTRRTAARCIVLICQYGRKPALYFSWLVQALLMFVIPVKESFPVQIHLGVLLCLRYTVPHLVIQRSKEQGLKGSFGVTKKEEETGVKDEQLVKIYEYLIHCTKHADHNVLTATLDALQQLLKDPPKPLLDILMSKKGIARVSIYEDKEKASPKHGEGPTATATEAEEGSTFTSDSGLDEDQYSTSAPSETSSSGLATTPTSTPYSSTSLESIPSSLYSATRSDRTSRDLSAFGDQSSASLADLEPENSELIVDDGTSDYSNMAIGGEEDNVGDVGRIGGGMENGGEAIEQAVEANDYAATTPSSDEILDSPGDTDDISPIRERTATIDEGSPDVEVKFRAGDIGSYTDEDLPLRHLLRLLSSSFLLTGYQGSLIPDRKARVSVKVLAMGCASHIIGMYPRVFFDHLFKGTEQGVKVEDEQYIRDLLLYVGHSDPQLRGQTLMLIGQLLHASLIESNYQYTDWCWQICGETNTDPVSIEYLVSLLSSAVSDDSSVTARSICQASKLCLQELCRSCHGSLGLTLTYDLLKLTSTTYWLVQVELLELISGFDFKLLHYLESRKVEELRRGYTFMREDIQRVVLEEVVFKLLGSEDGRVRTAAGDALSKLVPKLFYPVDQPHQESISSLAKTQVTRYLDPVMRDLQPYTPAITSTMDNLPVFHSKAPEGGCTFSESAFSRMVAVLFDVMSNTMSRYSTYGCVRALARLSGSFPVTVHPSAWGCSQNLSSLSRSHEGSHPKLQRQSSLTYKGGSGTSIGSTGCGASAEELAGGTGCGSLPVVVSLLTSSVGMLDLAAQHDMLQLATNLLLGAAANSLKGSSSKKNASPATSPSQEAEGSGETWQCLNNRLLVPIVEQVLLHVTRLVSIFSHVIDNHQPGPAKSQTALPSLPAGPSLSPIKRKSKIGRDKDTPDQSPATPQNPNKPTPDKSDASEEKKSTKSTYGSFYQHAHYMRLYEVLRGAYKNYKATLELTKPDKFCLLLKMSLSCLSQLLELASITEVGHYVEEILGYLKSCVTIEPTMTILCVEQLLKALFFTNMASTQELSSPHHARKTGKAARLTSNMKPGLYHDCFIAPYTQYTQCLASMGPKLTTTPDAENESIGVFGWIKTRADRRASLSSKSSKDKTAVQNYIRLFEPLVIRALKQYTVSSCVVLQQQVLHLLAQLVQLRVNYCLLDSDQIFLNFVIKQFEYLEEGLVKGYEVLIPHIFNFLVLLSYERFHSKPVIAMPKIIQLCDGIMASGQQASTHIVPALKPLVHDLFILRANNKSESAKELDTQREVVVSMLLRLIHYSQVLEMFTAVLQQAHRENEEKWKRLSRQVVDMILPLLARQQINLDTPAALDVLHHLLGTVAPSSLRPVDILLKALLLVPYDQVSVVSMQRWLAMALALLGVLTTQSKEETILSRLQELGLTSDLFICVLDAQHTKEDALNANMTPPEEVLARFLLQIVGFTVTTVQGFRSSKSIDGSGDQSHDFLAQELSRLLLSMTHMFKSGTFRKVGVMMASLIARPQQSKCWFALDSLNEAFHSLIQTDPILVLQWCQLLLLLNFDSTDWWMRILHTPKRPPLSKSLSSGSLDHLETNLETELSTAEEVVKQGALVLFCDYVCENEADAEPLTWLVVNHVNDIVQLSYELPVQDLVSAIHRNSAASGLFLRAINIRFNHMNNPCLVRQTLRLLEGIHLTQSGMLLTLLIEKFLTTHWQSIARVASGLACRRVEMLLAERVDQHTRAQLTHEELTKLEGFLTSNRLAQKNQRLMSLLSRLKLDLTVEEPAPSPPDLPSDLPKNLADVFLDKEWYVSIVQSCCCGTSPSSSSRDCATMLSRLSYEDIMAILTLEGFDHTLIGECISLGLARTQLGAPEHAQSPSSAQPPNATPTSTTPSSSNEHPLQATPVDALLKAAMPTLVTHLKSFAALVPRPHRILEPGSERQDARDYCAKMMECFQDGVWCHQLNDIVAALARYFLACRTLKIDLDIEASECMMSLTIASLELVSWSISEGKPISSAQALHSMECIAEILQHPELSTVIGDPDHVTWFCSAIGCIYHIIQAGKVWKEEHEPFTVPKLQEMPGLDLRFDHQLQACHRISELVELLNENTFPKEQEAFLTKTPQFLREPMKSVMVGLARLPSVNGFARTPPILWKMGWCPSPLERAQTNLPPIPLEFLKEKAVLRSFIQRVNSIGWTSRFQFEETWASLLGLLNPADNPEDVMVEEEMEQNELMCLAIRGITSLLLNTILRPSAGNPTNSRPLCIPRHDSLPFLATKKGQRLGRLRVLVEREMLAMQSTRSQKTLVPATSTAMEGPFDEMLTANMETEGNQDEFTLGQVSVHGIWAINNMILPLVEDQNQNRPEGSIIPLGRTAIPASLSRVPSNLDVHSCLVLLLEVYGQWLAPGSARRTSLMLLCETIKSVLLISDIFTERSQFEWMYETLLELNKIHPVEDELVTQYVIPGICKAASVLGMDKDVSEKVSKLLEVTLRSTHLPSRVGALYGVLYILESDAVEDIQVFVPMVTDYITRNIKAISNCSSSACQKHVLVMLSVAFYIMEYYSDLTAGSDFTKAILQQCVVMVLMSDESTSWLVYHAIMVGFERLLVAHALGSQERDMLKKLSVDRLCLPSPMHALSALGLLLTSMYTAEDGRGVSSDDDDIHHEMQPQDPEEVLLAMERVSIMFDRIRKGYPSEAKAVAFILPPFLNDFFPPQDIMNKVIGEFLSNQQPHPQLMATVVFKVFGNLHRNGQTQSVRDWVMLSLSNFTQRTPVAMAIWSLTCFFISASTNKWLRALLSHVINRMGKLEPVDRKYFILAAKDFYNTQVIDEASRRAFTATFQAVSNTDAAYALLA